MRLDEVRSVYRLVGEIRELGAVPEAWRTHMLHRLNAMLQTRVGFVIQARPYVEGNNAPLASVVSTGLNGREYEHFMQFLGQDILQDPSNAPRAELLVASRRGGR